MSHAPLRVGIVGASGYSGEELVRLLSRHPHASLTRVTSRTLAGKPIGEALPALRAYAAPKLRFTPSEPQELAADAEVDLWFLALPHGVAAEYALPLIQAGRTVIDLSADFRLNDPDLYASYYGHAHPAPELLASTPYIIPELAENDDWRKAPLLACPGCYPTSIQLPLVPLLREKLLSTKNIVVNSVSGISGAGKKAAEEYLFCERAESVKAYGIPRHRHLSEVEEQLSLAAGTAVTIQFNPHLVPMRRGIATTIVAPATSGTTQEDLHRCLDKTFAGKPFVTVLKPGQFPDTAHVVGTNQVQLAAVLDPRTDNAILTSVEDNLLKGASGQAVQLMNLRYGFPETAGLC